MGLSDRSTASPDGLRLDHEVDHAVGGDAERGELRAAQEEGRQHERHAHDPQRGAVEHGDDGAEHVVTSR
jgi:hypothetical protein